MPLFRQGVATQWYVVTPVRLPTMPGGGLARINGRAISSVGEFVPDVLSVQPPRLQVNINRFLQNGGYP